MGEWKQPGAKSPHSMQGQEGGRQSPQGFAASGAEFVLLELGFFLCVCDGVRETKIAPLEE